VVSAVGARICARSGLAAVRRFRSQVAEGRMPGMALLDGLWILVAGALLIVPGFVTDGFALLLLLPPVRRGASRLARAALARRVSTIVWP